MTVLLPTDHAPVTARMSQWLVVEAFGEECLFGFADEHPTTGGLSWVLSTRIVELSEGGSRARTASGRVYALGRRISTWDLDEEGHAALRLLLQQDEYPGWDDDFRWVMAQKMARHLGLTSPPRSDPVATDQFVTWHRDAYAALRSGRGAKP